MEHENIIDEGIGIAAEGLAEVGRYDFRDAADERALVVLAMGLPYWLFAGGTGFRLCVEAARAGEVQGQLALFEAEEDRRCDHAPVPEPDAAAGSGRSFAVFAALLIGVFAASRAPGTDLPAHTMLDATAIFAHGEWWRVVTALTLHADVAHLLSNLAGGALFAHFAVRRFGAGRAWFLIVATAIGANLATAWVFRNTGHLSLGASTAVFAALGLLAGRALVPEKPLRRSTAPTRPTLVRFAAALVLLTWLGGGTGNVDVVAHLAGFCFGVGAGFLAVVSGLSDRRTPAQAIWAVAALAPVAAAWISAVAAAPR